jgi:hypothetical protein
MGNEIGGCGDTLREDDDVAVAKQKIAGNRDTSQRSRDGLTGDLPPDTNLRCARCAMATGA